MWLQFYFCLKDVQREIPLKQFCEHVASMYIRHVMKVEVTLICVRGNIGKVGLT